MASAANHVALGGPNMRTAKIFRASAVAASLCVATWLSPASAAEVITFADLASGNCRGHGAAVTSGSFSFQANDSFFVCNPGVLAGNTTRSEEHTSELQSLAYLVCRLLL